MHMAHVGTLARPVRAEALALCAIPNDWDDAWDDLAAHASEPNPFYERWFLQPSITHLTPDADTRMIAVWSGRVLVGLLPVTVAAKYGRAPIRHIENWAHYHCFYGAPLVRQGFEVTFWEVALELLDAAYWAPGFLHLVGIDPQTPVMHALNAVRRADIVHRSERAMLASTLAPSAYYEAHVRKKKRKEIGRLRTRLDELGSVAFEALAHDADVAPWIADFLRLEASGWKGREGSALGTTPATTAFFREAVSGAHRAGRLELVRLTLDGQPIAMLVNFITAPGGYAFKIAFDEDYARFSPGVLIKIENLKLLDRKDIEWMDSCASEDHPMINSLWAERRQIVRVTVPLAGALRQATFVTARALETASAIARGKR
jgi:CelD/BcsL family acetyltransferase involved in cellulose biosynthesis